MLPAETPSPKLSVIIRTWNEARHLPGVLNRLARQRERRFEVIVVDSGSTDSTVEVAKLAGARIVHISKADFTFGRSLNKGCEAARGEILVFISGHCYPIDRNFLGNVLEAFANDDIGLVYGKQRGGPKTKFSEHRHLAKTFPARSAIPQQGFFCNNANCAVRKSLWKERHFDESLTGLEDLDWAKWLVTSRGKRAAYCAEAGVYHLHDEQWSQVFRRYEREAIALKTILPDMKFSFLDFVSLFGHSAVLDLKAASARGVLRKKFAEIVSFRLMQFYGTYKGAHYHRRISQEMKEKFFYPGK